MRGVSTSPRSSSRSPAPSLPRSQAHSSLPTPTPRGPNTGCGPAILPAASPSPAPAARPSMMLALQGFASYKTLGHGTPLPGRELELGTGGAGMATLWGPSVPVPKAQTGTGTGWLWKGTDCSGRGHSRGHQPLGCSRSFRATGHVCCHAVQLPGPLCLFTLLGLPWHPGGAGAVCLSQNCLITSQ